MTTFSRLGMGSATGRRAHGHDNWLALAASPTFALMAWITVNDRPMAALCSSGSGILPIDGMTAMYLLMSLFHLPPWLKFAFNRSWMHTRQTTED